MTLSPPPVGVGKILIFIAVVFVLGRIFSVNERSMPYPIRRTIGILIFSGLVAGVITLFIEDTNYIRYALAGYYLIGAVCLVGLLFGFKFVKPFYLVHDLVCGHIIFIPLFLFGALQLPGMIQTWLLYHNALSQDVVVSDILRYARKTQESGSGENTEDLMEQMTELRKVVQKQEEILVSAGLSTRSGYPSTPTTSGYAMSSYPTLPSGPDPVVRSADKMPARGSYGRAVSMTGLDLWRQMALGDVDEPSVPPPPPPARPLYQEGVGTGTMAPNPAAASSGFSFTQPDTMPPR
jgi:callose synthase